jgi:hypothetical protein
MRLFEVEIDWSGTSSYFVVANSEREALEAAEQSAEADDADLRLHCTVAEACLPPDRRLLSERVISPEGSGWKTVADWWADDDKDLTESEAAALYRLELEAKGQARLFP